MVDEAGAVLHAAASGDRAATLKALRDRLALEIDTISSARDLAALSRQLTEVLDQLESVPKPAEGTPLDELADRRRGAGAARAARAQRKPQRPR